MTSVQVLADELLYPSSDDEPMADSTKQYEWIVFFKENLERLFVRDRQVFIAADLFWYPVAVTEPPAPRQAPDVMVVLGRPKGHRKSYRQWTENGIAPQVVFEILSASNKTRQGLEKMDEKLLFYQRYGVEEYYLYDPDEYTLEGYFRRGQVLEPLPASALQNWYSPRLGIILRARLGRDLEVFYPDGRPFLSFLDLANLADFEASRADRAQQSAEQEAQRAEQEAQRANQAEAQLSEAQARAERLAEQLRALGIEPDAPIAD